MRTKGYYEAADRVVLIMSEHLNANETESLQVTVRQYAGSEYRMVIDRWFRTKRLPEWKHTKLKRLSAAEARSIGQGLLDAADAIENGTIEQLAAEQLAEIGDLTKSGEPMKSDWGQLPEEEAPW